MSPNAAARALASLGLDRPGGAPFPRKLRPMLATSGRHPFNDPDWVYEPKWDGFRTLAGVRGGDARLWSRNLHPFTDLFRPIADALEAFPTSLVLDGEVVALDAKGIPDFEALQQRLRRRPRRAPGTLVYLVFDCLYVNGHSLMARPLEARQDILRALRPALEAREIRVPESLPGVDGRIVFREAVKLGLEGVVAKRRASLYRPGQRSPDWVTIAARRREEFVVGGYLASRSEAPSALLVGRYDQAGKLRYAGLVAAGVSADARRALLDRLRALHRTRCPFAPAPVLRDPFGQVRTGRPPQWVKPDLVVEVEFRRHTDDGLRHAALKGIRPDKTAREVVEATPAGRPAR